ncbi:MAG: beta-N-acetylhexosaminidase [Algicola sp.]|nr:beta-N-acetylhexosaminidase [Algicola sp.]
MGPLMLDLTGCELSAEEKELLQHPNTGGVIIFTRNYDSPKQMLELVGQIRRYARDEVIIAVDHEGGRVQRFREGVSAIPSMGSLFPKADENLERSRVVAKEMGWLMATEVLAVGIDISFAPVLDIWGISEVIGDRSFHQDPKVIVAVAGAFIDGMFEAGMQATGKHFPGHGNVLEDSHIAIPVDKRSREEIYNLDLAVFEQLINANKLAGMMPAHVIYPAIDESPAGFSSKWINGILNQELGFKGVVFSDDLAMHGATVIGSYEQRAEQALAAGCDMVLVCNDRSGAVQVLDSLPIGENVELTRKLMTLRAKCTVSWENMHSHSRWNDAQKLLDQLR